MTTYKPGTVVRFRIASGRHDGIGLVTNTGGIAWVPAPGSGSGAFNGISVCAQSAALDVRPVEVPDVKPTEPTDLYAVVEDADGDIYIRMSDNLKRPWLRAGTSNHVGWSEIDATPVVVLSEGVSDAS